MDLEDLQQIAATVQVKTICLVVCILHVLMMQDHQVFMLFSLELSGLLGLLDITETFNIHSKQLPWVSDSVLFLAVSFSHETPRFNLECWKLAQLLSVTMSLLQISL